MSVSKKHCGPNARPGVANTRPCGPNASQWNIVCVGYARVGFALFIPFFYGGYPTRTQCSVEYGLIAYGTNLAVTQAKGFTGCSTQLYAHDLCIKCTKE